MRMARREVADIVSCPKLRGVGGGGIARLGTVLAS